MSAFCLSVWKFPAMIEWGSKGHKSHARARGSMADIGPAFRILAWRSSPVYVSQLCGDFTWDIVKEAMASLIIVAKYTGPTARYRHLSSSKFSRPPLTDIDKW